MALISMHGSATAWLRDFAWRTVYRVGFPLARIWWRLRRQRHEGALVAVHVGSAVLMLRSSYRAAWNFPGGGVRPNETPEAAARRELAEETGIVVASTLLPVGSACGIGTGGATGYISSRCNWIRSPALHFDNREIVGGRLVSPGEWSRIPMTAPVAHYPGQQAGARP